MGPGNTRKTTSVQLMSNILLVVVVICLFLLLFFFFVTACYPGGHCKEVRACKLQGAQGGDFQSIAVNKVLERCFVLPRCLFYNFGYMVM